MTFNSIKLLGLSVLTLSATAFAQTEDIISTPVLVCRAQQCAEARYSMTKGFLFNKIAQMMKKNENKDVLICEADPVSHVCLSEGIVLQARTAFDVANISIDKLHLNDVKLSPDSELDLVFDYKIRANRTYPACQLGRSYLAVNSVNNVELMTDDFDCTITETGNTSINASYEINYLDFDYGFMGVYYTLGVGEAVTGDKSGYALMRFTERVPLTKTPPTLDIDQNTMTVLPPADEEKIVTTQTSSDVVAQTAPASATVIQEVAKPKTTVIKTTTVEKMVINPDGTKEATPPETRTIVEELNK